MSNLPLWHDDMFACYPPMIEQLQKLVSRGVVKIIKEADDINDLVGDNPTIKPLEGAIYVIFDNNTPTESNNEGKEQFVQANPLPVQYKNGFGYFSKRYTTTIATCADDLF